MVFPLHVALPAWVLNPTESGRVHFDFSMADNTHNKGLELSWRVYHSLILIRTALPQELSQPNYRTISETRTEQVSPAKLDKPSVVELKNGKLVLRQKPLSLEKLSETMQGAFSVVNATKLTERFIQKLCCFDKCSNNG